MKGISSKRPGFPFGTFPNPFRASPGFPPDPPFRAGPRDRVYRPDPLPAADRFFPRSVFALAPRREPDLNRRRPEPEAPAGLQTRTLSRCFPTAMRGPPLPHRLRHRRSRTGRRVRTARPMRTATPKRRLYRITLAFGRAAKFSKTVQHQPFLENLPAAPQSPDHAHEKRKYGTNRTRSSPNIAQKYRIIKRFFKKNRIFLEKSSPRGTGCFKNGPPFAAVICRIWRGRTRSPPCRNSSTRRRRTSCRSGSRG